MHHLLLLLLPFLLAVISVAASSATPTTTTTTITTSRKMAFVRPTTTCTTRLMTKFTSFAATSRSRSRAASLLCMSSSSSSSSSNLYMPELLIAIRASRHAGIVAKSLQKTLLENKSAAISKTDSSPVTIADFSVQALVVSEIRHAFPQDQVIGEENSSVLRQDPQALEAVTEVVRREAKPDMLVASSNNNEEQQAKISSDDVCQVLDHGSITAKRTWILDPIDGTKGFIRGQHFCVALGLAQEGKPVLGVLACPNVPYGASRDNGNKLGEGCVFFAVKGQGAFMLPLVASKDQSLEEEIQAATKIHVSDVSTGAQARFFESAEAAHSSHSAAADVNTALGVQAAPVRLDSQCKYGMLARGEGEIMLRLPRLGYVENSWDHAPAYVVITEAGGRVTDTNGKELDFSEGCRTGSGKMGEDVTGIVTTNGKMHEQVLQALSKSWPPSK